MVTYSVTYLSLHFSNLQYIITFISLHFSNVQRNIFISTFVQLFVTFSPIHKLSTLHIFRAAVLTSICLFFTNFLYFKLCCCAQIHKKINWMRPKTLTASAGFYSRLKIFFEAKFPFYVRTMHGFTYFM